MVDQPNVSEDPRKKPEAEPLESKPASAVEERGPASESHEEPEGQRRTAARPVRGVREGFRGREGGRGRGGRSRDRSTTDSEESRFEERVVKINRCATVVKGGRRFSFSALVVVGDRQGMVGVGFGKANEVPPSVEKAIQDGRKNFVKVSLNGNTIPHKVSGTYRTSQVILLPASEGTGVIAGSAVRSVVECAGIRNLLSKVYGSTNPLNVVKATMDALRRLRNREDVMKLRGVEIP